VAVWWGVFQFRLEMRAPGCDRKTEKNGPELQKPQTQKKTGGNLSASLAAAVRLTAPCLPGAGRNRGSADRGINPGGRRPRQRDLLARPPMTAFAAAAGPPLLDHAPRRRFRTAGGIE